MKSRHLFIHAVNVHQGGGRTLLLSITHSLPTTERSVLCIDDRMNFSDTPSKCLVKRVKPTILQRFLAERWLVKSVAAGDVVLCFGNLPPLFRLHGHVTVFLQNRYLIDNVKPNQFPLKIRLRLAVERFWLSIRMVNVDEFVVQTPSMKKLLEALTEKPVHILPFIARHEEYARKARKAADTNVNKPTVFDFLYVASGEPHKNHRRLIEAWCLLAKQGVFPSLRLTFDEASFPDLHAFLEKTVAQYGLNIQNVGGLPYEQILESYKKARALIYPSTFESLGLPLIEARQAGLSILAPELDYVRDVIDPEESFDSSSATSIARAVKRYLGVEEASLPLLDAADFLKNILERASQSARTCH